MAVTLHLPQFGEQYEGAKSRRLVEEIERLQRALNQLSLLVSQGGGGGGSATLAGLDDTTISSPAAGQFLAYLGGVWVNRSLQASDIPAAFVTQHQEALVIDVEQITNLPTEGVSDHGGLTGLNDDDHPQYHNDARGDARYSLLGHTHTALLPAGGSTGQVLKKASGTDYDTEWSDVADQADFESGASTTVYTTLARYAEGGDSVPLYGVGVSDFEEGASA